MVRKILAHCYIYLIMLLLYAPILVLIVFSFTTTPGLGSFENGFSFDLYGDLFNNTEIMVALGNTLIIAVVSALISTIIGTCGAIGAYYSKKRSRVLMENVNQIPVVNAEIVIALSLTFMFVLIGFNFGFFTLVVGHCVLCVPFVYLNVKPRLVSMDPSMYEAALDLGATPSRALTKVVVPSILPGIFSGFLLSITLSLDDFIVTAFLRGPGLLSGDGSIETLSTYVQAKIKKKEYPPELRALTTIIFLIVLSIVIGYSIYTNQKAKGIMNKKRRKA